MSIESSSPSQNSRAVAGATHGHGKKTGKPDAGAGEVVGGFSALINLLSAADPQDDSVADTALPLADGTAVDVDKNMPLAQMDTGRIAMNLIPEQSHTAVAADMAATATPEQPELGASAETARSALSGLPASAGSTDPGVAGGVVPGGVPALVASSSAVPPGHSPQTALSAAKPGSGQLDVLNKSSVSAVEKPGYGLLVADQSVQSQMDSFFGQKSVAGQTQVLSAAQIELREVKTHPLILQQANAPDVSAALSLPGAGDLLSFPKNRLGAKPGLTPGAAGSGSEGVFGSAAAGYAPTDAVYKIESPSAVVPDTAIAETVSYWVTHGVQSAELTLDGPDNKSVEVSIVLNGDQAQIEFRTDQADMRQILEGATTHLKELLSDQGLQLAGVSVGASGAGGTPSDGRQQRPATRQAVWVSTPPTVSSVGRSANPSVGRTLDLFV